jgi:hypothetical protein
MFNIHFCIQNVNMTEWFEVEEELKKQHSLSDSSVSSLFLQMSQVTIILALSHGKDTFVSYQSD